MIHPGSFLENSWRVPRCSAHAVVLDTDLADRDTLAGLLSECLRVSRAGAHVLVRSEVLRTHLAAVALGDAGWEIEDRVTHFHGDAAEDWWLGTKPGGKKFLNVEACRAGGRWPAHVAFTHHGDCRTVGTRRTGKLGCYTGWGHETGIPRPRNTGHALNFSRDASLVFDPREALSWVNEDGTETVAEWACHDSCAVRRLDDRAGALLAGESQVSRFFNTFTSVQEFLLWLVRLITPPGGTVLFPSGPSAAVGFPTIGFKEPS